MAEAGPDIVDELPDYILLPEAADEVEAMFIPRLPKAAKAKRGARKGRRRK